MTTSAKNGFCPICRSQVKRQGLRKEGKRFNVVPHHFYKDAPCGGTYLPWEKAIRKVQKFKIGFVDISDGRL